MAKRRTKSEKRFIRLRKELDQADPTILESRKRLLERVKETQEQAGYDLELRPSGSLKMSEVILDFAQPLMDLSRNVDQQKKAVALAILAWNLSLLPEEEWKEAIAKIRSTAPKHHEPGQDLSTALMSLMIKRKKDLYPDLNRIILDHDIAETPQRLHLNVVSKVVIANQQVTPRSPSARSSG